MVSDQTMEMTVDDDQAAPANKGRRKPIPRYLSRAEVAKKLGVKNSQSLSKTKLPPPDAIVGSHRGWLESTIDKWNETRPGSGRWGAREN